MSGGTVRVSVALATRDGARHVEEQVRSVLEQTLPPAQVVLSDDASSDGTVEIVRRLVTQHGGVELVVLENPEPLGVRRNVEQALRHCTGDLVALCDQDDRWHPERLERVAAAFAADPGLLLVHSDARLVDGDGRPFGAGLAATQRLSPEERAELTGGRSLATLLRRSVVTGATVVLRRSLLDLALPVPEEWVHDEWLAVVAAAAGRTVFLDEQLIDYRQHGGNQIGVVHRGLRARVARLMLPREERNARLEARARVLVDRLAGLAAQEAVREEVVDAARAKLAHDAARRRLPAVRVLRVVPVLRELVTGRYGRYGRGRQDVARDLLQPAR